jgi:streptogramin lyase
MLKHPYRDPATPTSRNNRLGPSVFWGAEPIWDSHTSTHSPMIDEKGRVWFTARIRQPGNPDYCNKGSDNEAAAVAPLADSNRQLSFFDPKTGKWTMIDTCFTTHHLAFGYDPDNTLWLSAGSPASGVVGWLDVKKFDETGDEVHAQGWTPIVTDVVGNGRREAFARPEEKLEPGKDKWIRAGFYGISPSPQGDVIWGQSMGTGFSGKAQPSLLIRLAPGANPPETAMSEIFQAPEGAFGMRGVDVDSKGVAWTVLSSGHLGGFDRRKCHAPLTGLNAATGAQCPEGWTLYRFPGPQFEGADPNGAADHAYYVWIDRFDILGLGADTPIAMTNGGEALLAFAHGKFITLRIPWPMGFFAKNVDGRIDDPQGGWKGRGLWTTSGTRANFHGEGGKGVLPKVFKLQLRPDPLAH